MAVIQWIALGSGDFDVGANWGGGNVPSYPNGADLGTLDGDNYTVTIKGGQEFLYSIDLAKNAVLDIKSVYSASGLTVGPGNSSNYGTIIAEIETFGLTLNGGTFSNNGLIEMSSFGGVSSNIGVESNCTLTGQGTVSLTGDDLEGATGATLTNEGNTIIGWGQVGTGTNFGLVNQAEGVFVADHARSTLTIGGGGTVTNAGLMESAGGGSLAVVGSLDQSGGGRLMAGTGSNVVLEAAVIVGGTLASAGTGAVVSNTAQGATLDGRTAVISISGTMRDITQLTIEGAFADTGAIEITYPNFGPSADLIIGSAGATLSGGGEVALNDNAGIGLVRLYGATASTILTSGVRITGDGLLGNGQLALVNEAAGKIIGDTANVLTVDCGTNTILNAGLIAASGKGGATVKSAIDNTGVLFAAKGNLTIEGAVTGSGQANINGARLDFASTFDENVTFTVGTGVLELSDSQAYGGKIFGLSTKGASSLDLDDIAFTQGVTKASYADNGKHTAGVLTVTDGTNTTQIHLVGDYSASTFTTSSDGHGGTIVKDPAASAARLSHAIAAMGPGPYGASVAPAPTGPLDRPILAAGRHAAIP